MNFPFQLVISLIAAIDSGRKAVIPDHELAEIPPERRVEKPAAASLIVPSNWEEYLTNLRDLPTLLGFNKSRGWLEVLGGGLQSIEEEAMDAIMGGATFPDLIDPKNEKPTRFGGSFYHIQAMELLVHGQMRQLVYNTQGGDNDQLAALREVVEEGIIDGVNIVKMFPNAVNVGVPFRPFNMNLSRVLQEKFPGMYDGTETYAQIVAQRGFLATVDVTAPELPTFADNTEIGGLKWVTLQELFELAKAKAGQEANLPAAVQGDTLRNTVPLHFTKWFVEWLIAQQRDFSW